MKISDSGNIKSKIIFRHRLNICLSTLYVITGSVLCTFTVIILLAHLPVALAFIGPVVLIFGVWRLWKSVWFPIWYIQFEKIKKQDDSAVIQNIFDK